MASGVWCYITKNIPLFSLISQTYTVHTFDHILYVYGISYTVHIWSHWSKLNRRFCLYRRFFWKAVSSTIQNVCFKTTFVQSIENYCVPYSLVFD